MSNSMKKNRRQVSKSRLAAALRNVVETMESRVMMSTTVAAWNFNGITAAVNLSPAPSTGTGTASSVGMQATGTAGVAPYPTANATGPDVSVIEFDAGSSDPL